MEELEKNENQPYVDPDEIKRPTSFKAWVENFWYHYKWHTIVGAFVVIVLGVMIGQMATRVEYDIRVIYSGPVQLSGGDLALISEAFTEFVQDDGNGDGKKNVVTYGEYLLSPEQQEALAEEARRKSIEENVEYVFLYNAEDRNNALNSVNMKIATGDAVICLMDKYNYDILCENDAIESLESVLGYCPDFAIDDYGVYLKDTDFGKYFQSAFEPLPDDTILCIRKKATIGTEKNFDSIYECHVAVFKSVFAFIVPER